MDAQIKIRKQNAAAARSADSFLKAVWRYADSLFDVRLPYTPVLEEFALMSGKVKVSRTLITRKLRLQGDHDDISAILKMFLASQIGSAGIA